MKIGIITFQRANNYGAMFQAYALSKYLEQQGHDVFILNYATDDQERVSFSSKLYKFIVVHRCSFKHFYKRIFLQAIVNQREKLFVDKFIAYRKQHLKLTSKSYTYEDLCTQHPMADVYITGSDQVWNTDFTSCSMGYLLAFLPDGIKRISYAASFGKKVLDSKYHQKFKDELIKFTAISVREKNGLDIVQDVASIDATLVVDPTFLLSDYSELIDYSLVPEKPYIFVYRLSQNRALTTWMSALIKKASNKENLPVYTVSTNGCYKDKEYGEQLIPTPGQFLGLLEKANFFVTNSFHGSVFSILFKTPFIVTARDQFPDQQNLRMVELLNNFRLSERYLPPFASFEQIDDILNNTFDFDEIHNRVRDYKKTSEDFLKFALCKDSKTILEQTKQ